MKMRRFQTKLMLAFVAVTVLVSATVIQSSGRRVKNAYQRQFKQAFDSQVNYMLEAREARSSNQLALGKKLAESPFVISRLTKTREVGRAEFIEAINGAMFPMVRGGRGSASRILAVMTLDGQIEYLNDAPGETARRGGRQKAPGRWRLESIRNSETPHVAYLPQGDADGQFVVREVIVTPVKEPESSELLGAFIMSLTSVSTGAERIIERYHMEIGGGKFGNAIYLNGVLYPSRGAGIRFPVEKSRSEFDFSGLAPILDAEIERGDERSGDFEAEFAGEAHYVHYYCINPDSAFEPTWHVSAFPMTALKAELNELRIRGSGVGLAGLIIGVLASWFFAGNLSGPIRALSEGTRKIREGDLDATIPIRGKDELGELTASFNEMTEELRQKERYRELLEKVSDESVAQAMIQGSLHPELGGEVKEVTILFCDIRGFTSLTETMEPTEVIEMLNQHMTAMTKLVRDHFGVVDKFVGDEIMAVFGGIKSYGNDAAHAFQCALSMIEERERLNGEGGIPLPIGIGIVTGEVVAGCMGSKDRLNYTVLGAKVNLAARLCGKARSGEVLMDEDTVTRAGDALMSGLNSESIQLKGFSLPVPVWSSLDYRMV